jgi:hypothetical protein
MTDLVGPTPESGDIQYGKWIGRGALPLMFIFNGFGIFRSIPSLPSHIAEIHAPASR